MINKGKRYTDASDFYKLDGDAIMKLSKNAALKVCEMATKNSDSVVIIEGGHWKSSKFQSCLDAIWEYGGSSTNVEEVNKKAAKFIDKISSTELVDTFILTLD